MNHRCSELAVGLALVAMMSSAVSGAPQSSSQAETALPRDVTEPPSHASHLCSGSAIGESLPDGRPGPHVIWDSYSSRESPAHLAKRYLKSLGSEAHDKLDGCDLWRLPPDKPRRTLEVCPVAAAGFWTECSKAPRGTASIIVISSMARAD